MPSTEFPFTKALITGASAGIGSALATRLAAEGVGHLILVARRKDRLDTLATALRDAHDCQVDCVVADLSTHQGLTDTIGHAHGVDLLVNNAGFGSFGHFEHLESEREQAMIDLNCKAPVALAHAVLPGMLAQEKGCILNIASGQSFGAMPFMSTYAATKAFLLHWAEGLRAELGPKGVSVTTVCPGAIATEFNQAASIPEGEISTISLVSGSMDGVVDACLSAIRDDRGISIPGFRNWMAVSLGRISPRAIAAWTLARILRTGADRAKI